MTYNPNDCRASALLEMAVMQGRGAATLVKFAIHGSDREHFMAASRVMAVTATHSARAYLSKLDEERSR